MDYDQLEEANLYFKCCRVCYMFEEPVDPKVLLSNYGLKIIQVIGDNTQEVNYVIMERFVIGTNDRLEIVVAFRGLVESFDFGDLLPGRDPSPIQKNRKAMLMDIHLVRPPDEIHNGDGRYHGGMIRYVASYEKSIKEQLRNIPDWQNYPIAVTGFSMGCGLSTLTAMLIRAELDRVNSSHPVKLINFCSPKICDRAFADDASRRLQSYENYYIYGDPVPSFPDDPDYVLGGDVIVFCENSKTVLGKDWHCRCYLYKEGPPDPSYITPQKMRMGVLNMFNPDCAIPSIEVLSQLSRFHSMSAMKAVISKRPIPTREVEQWNLKDQIRSNGILGIMEGILPDPRILLDPLAIISGTAGVVNKVGHTVGHTVHHTVDTGGAIVGVAGGVLVQAGASTVGALTQVGEVAGGALVQVGNKTSVAVEKATDVLEKATVGTLTSAFESLTCLARNPH